MTWFINTNYYSSIFRVDCMQFTKFDYLCMHAWGYLYLTRLLSAGVVEPSLTTPCSLFMYVAYVRNSAPPAPIRDEVYKNRPYCWL